MAQELWLGKALLVFFYPEDFSWLVKGLSFNLVGAQNRYFTHLRTSAFGFKHCTIVARICPTTTRVHWNVTATQWNLVT